ncbi:hypothetical protein [Prosthecodimorpha staleyi]|uniref:Uncharacterized protein n=1 Tax=Prosthecodimorpha staleyi TaxID=2840188 RepID=A0A947D4I7_9HYPH|nr:hypothetical protein [Prosthecodimorpha staleyi]MBT9290635.1 hypothetical protein [Prosthecodimorpha staleyi]
MQKGYQSIAAGLRGWFEWYYGVTKRADHSRIIITGLIVAVGSILSPWWLPIIFEIAKKYIQIELKIESQPWVGVIVFLIVCVYSFSIFISDKIANNNNKKSELASDALVFRDLLSNSSPANFIDNIRAINARHLYNNDQLILLDKLIDILEDPSKEIINNDLRIEADKLHSLLIDFRDFLGTHFFVFPKSRPKVYTYALYPEWNMDHSGIYDEQKNKLYNTHADNLFVLTKKLLASYDDFFRTGRRVLGAAMPPSG